MPTQPVVPQPQPLQPPAATLPPVPTATEGGAYVPPVVAPADAPATTGRDSSGAPSIVGLGDGTVLRDGTFVPAADVFHAPGASHATPSVARPALSSDFAEKLRRVVAERNDALLELPDGSVQVSVIVTEEQALCIREWAIGADEPFHVYLKRHIETCIEQGTMAGNAG